MLLFPRSLRAAAILAAGILFHGFGPSAQAAVTMATSFLVIQGDFDSGTPGLESYRWKVEYQKDDTSGDAALETGADLMIAVFGFPLSSGSYDDPVWGGTFPHFTASSSQGTATYYEYSVYNPANTYTFDRTQSNFLVSFAKDGNTLDNGVTNSWIYWAVGGGYGGSTFEQNDWFYSYAGMAGRTLEDGSFDAWRFGTYGPDFNPDTYVEGISPTAGSFSDLTTVVASGIGLHGYTYTIYGVPEPGRGILLLLGGAAACWRRRRE